MSESTATHDPETTLAYALATWVFLLKVDGVAPDDAELSAACDAVLAAEEQEAGDKAGLALVHAVQSKLQGTEPADVQAFAASLYGDRVETAFGAGDRPERLARIRKYQFDRNLPWLARIWERNEDVVGPMWLVVERVTDEVTAMDPNPWNDIDETRHLPVSDFQVLWELDACTAVAVR
jgi:hypothetical protein